MGRMIGRKHRPRFQIAHHDRTQTLGETNTWRPRLVRTCAAPGKNQWPLTAVRKNAPVWTLNRERHLGYQGALNYNIVVNWVIAEHKSQGLFQTDCGRHNREQFWLFDISGPHATDAVTRLFAQLETASPEHSQ